MFMALFQKKTTLVHHITYMGIMTAINLIFILLATYLTFLMFLLVLILPFISAVVAYYCQKRYYIIYAVASIGLCMIFNIQDTLFYVIPAVITGFVMGVLLDKKVYPFWMLLSTSIIEAALTFAFIPLINLIGNIDIVDTFISAFRLSDFEYKTELTYLFIFFISLLQCGLTHFILLSDAKKIGIEVNTRVDSFAPFIIGSSLSMILALVFAMTYTPLAFVFMAVSIYFVVFLLIDIITCKNKIAIIVLASLLVLSFFGFAIFYPMVKAPNGLILVVLFSFSITIASFVNNYLLKGARNI